MANSITFHPVVFANHKRTDGTYNVKIRVTFKRRDRKLPTTLYASRDDLTRSLTIRQGALLDKADDIIREMRRAVADLNPFALDEMTVDDVVAHIRRRLSAQDFSLDFFDWSKQAIATKTASSARNYDHAVKKLQEYVGRDSLDINEMTSSMLRGFEDWLREQYGSNARAVSLYTSGVAHIHALARRRYNDEECERVRIRNPYEYYKPAKQGASRHRDIDTSIVRDMLRDRETLTGTTRLGVDFFLISFFTMGTNLVDLYEMKPERDGVLSYNRAKTRGRRADAAEMRVRVVPVARDLIDEYRDRSSDASHEFTLARRYARVKDAGRAVNDGLRRYCKQKSIETVFTYYSARHAWATTAYSAGVNPSIITDCLCHVDAGRRIDNVYVKKDWGIMWDANAQTIAYALKRE